ncbi:S1C family serine protease [Streptomyces sp. MI02-7b]|uniref:S1C family serine protease n=1 Tax=Streptomyces sp. MI02-7b TaxID=462941 RepID=UPI0029A6B509|nr:trypsin-like peptidase domain-containing protein [Streptomyces sp. MI02-7b]MDX3076479.1 trypsin-like peptidase domain-containing protein [Streptomyces sp. MI02-7b]
MNENSSRDSGADEHRNGPAAYPPPPPYEPQAPAYGTHQPPYGAPAPAEPAARRESRRTVPLVATVALVSALVGGGTAALIGNATASQTATTSTRVVGASATGTSSVASVAAAVSPSIVEVSATSSGGRSTGSGVIVTSGGEIVTNNHVISGADTVKVRFSSGKTATAKVVGTDSAKDLALLRAEDVSGLTPASLGDSRQVAVGDEVVAIGSPEGLTGTVTSGIVSALDRNVTVAADEGQGQSRGQRQGRGYGGGDSPWPFQFGGGQYNGDVGSSTTTYKAIQTDASLNPGNSGGALINMNGEIIGINSAMYSASSSSAGDSTAGSIGLGFAIPVNTVKADLDTLRNGGSDS